MKLSLICPCYNEEHNIAPLVEEIEKCFTDYYNYEIVFINDGSSDNTFDKLKEVKANSRCNIRIINLSRNFGKEAAMLAGLNNCQGDLISIIDGDMQQDPSVVEEMIKILDANSHIDCVCAYQINRNEKQSTKIFKNVFYTIADKFTEVTFKNGASDFRTFRKNVKDAILSMGEYHRFSKGIFSFVGFNTYYIPYEAKKRNSGKSSFSFFKLLKYGVNGIISFSTAPLKLASIVGTSAIFFSVIYTIVTIVRKLFSNIAVDGFTQLVILISFLGGIQLFCIGIIGEYIAKNYIETKRRPIYITKEIIDYNKF